MSGIEIAPLAEGMLKNIEQNMLTQMQTSAQEGKIPQIAELNKENAQVQDSLADKLTDSGEQKMLTPEGEITENSLLSDIPHEESQIYKDAGLEQGTVNGRECLGQPEIGRGLDVKDALGRTNLERMQEGLSPLDKSGKPYELHHVGQKNDGILAELRQDEHRASPNNTTLHPIRSGSEVDHGIGWDNTRASHWKDRAAQLMA